MEKNSIDKYFMSPSREETIWKNCIFVFDTSALLNFYNYSPQTKDFLFNEVFPKIERRLWMPNQVEFEYLKNRTSTFKKPIKEKYEKLIEEDIGSIEKYFKSISNHFEGLKNKTKRKFAHPYLSHNIFGSFDKAFVKSLTEFQELVKTIKNEIEDRKKEILSLAGKDKVLDGIEKSFETGKPFSFDQMLDIAKEGEFRYKYKIPPGYEDIETKRGKTGLQVYGDLIIWKQILEYARTSTRPLVLITDDVKVDWCYLEKSGSDIRITRPREELIREIFDFASVDFWMYTLSQFLYNIDKYYGIKPKDEVISDVEVNVKDENLKYDSFYYSPEHSYFKLLKFFDDGEVIAVTLADEITKKSIQNKVKKWFKKGYSDRGVYKLFENNIEFSIKSSLGIVDYKGTIEGKTLKLNTHSHINGHKSTRLFTLLETE